MLQKKNEKLEAELEELKGRVLELEGIVAELQAKVQMLKKLAQDKGLGDQIEDLLKEAGLDPVVKMKLRSVFERLYRDFWERMRRLERRIELMMADRNKEYMRTTAAMAGAGIVPRRGPVGPVAGSHGGEAYEEMYRVHEMAFRGEDLHASSSSSHPSGARTD